MHFCHEELLAILSLIPFGAHYVLKARSWFHRRNQCACPVEEGQQSCEQSVP